MGNSARTHLAQEAANLRLRPICGHEHGERGGELDVHSAKQTKRSFSPHLGRFIALCLCFGAKV